MEFRLLRADEIDARVGTVKSNGVSVLLYKDARCDMNILDETVGCMNWQRSHSRDNANCTVSIWSEQRQIWVSKEDTGTESNTEKEKGLASDSFKRACTNWGIGRELYTAPFIWFSAEECKLSQKGNSYTTYDRFRVDEIAYDGRKIAYLKITDTTTKVVKEYGRKTTIGEKKANTLKALMEESGSDIPKALQYYGAQTLADLTETQYTAIVTMIKRKKDAGNN